MDLTIALAQLASEPGDPTANLIRAARLVCETPAAQILALPELFACGYDPDSIAADPVGWSLTAEPGPPAPDSPLAPLASAAAQAKTWVLAGASVATAGRPHNGIVVIDASGSVRGHYAKTHLWGFEKKAFDPGADLVMIEIEKVSIGLGICYDAGFPELSRAYAQAGAHAVLFCSAFATGPTEHRYRVYHPARALENTVYTLVANAVGDIAGETYFGDSGAWSPAGTPLGAAGPEEGVSVVEISLAEIGRARAELPYLTDLRTDLLTAGATHVTRLR